MAGIKHSYHVNERGIKEHCRDSWCKLQEWERYASDLNDQLIEERKQIDTSAFNARMLVDAQIAKHTPTVFALGNHEDWLQAKLDANRPISPLFTLEPVDFKTLWTKARLVARDPEFTITRSWEITIDKTTGEHHAQLVDRARLHKFDKTIDEVVMMLPYHENERYEYYPRTATREYESYFFQISQMLKRSYFNESASWDTHSLTPAREPLTGYGMTMGDVYCAMIVRKIESFYKDCENEISQWETATTINYEGMTNTLYSAAGERGLIDDHINEAFVNHEKEFGSIESLSLVFADNTGDQIKALAQGDPRATRLQSSPRYVHTDVAELHRVTDEGYLIPLVRKNWGIRYSNARWSVYICDNGSREPEVNQYFNSLEELQRVLTDYEASRNASELLRHDGVAYGEVHAKLVTHAMEKFYHRVNRLVANFEQFKNDREQAVHKAKSDHQAALDAIELSPRMRKSTKPKKRGWFK